MQSRHRKGNNFSILEMLSNFFGGDLVGIVGVVWGGRGLTNLLQFYIGMGRPIDSGVTWGEGGGGGAGRNVLNIFMFIYSTIQSARVCAICVDLCAELSCLTKLQTF